MIAAVYARKSTEQTGVADEQKSVARQVEHARAYAQRKAWAVADEHVYIDDGISGAEFARRPGFVRLMAALSPRPPFQVLIMSEESRLGREAIETAYALKQLTRAGVRVFFYLEDRERTLETPIDKAMFALQAMSDEMERQKASLRVKDAMRRKAEQRHVTGGQCFGYRNVDVTAPGPDGRPKRQYVTREIVQEEASTIRRIFELCARGEGLKGITKIFNDDGTPAPRAQRGRPNAWAPSSVREILSREMYRGVIVWNKTRKRDADGQKRPTDRPAAEWMRIPAEELRIVSDALWAKAHEQLEARRHYYRLWSASAGARRPEARGSKFGYLLSGFAVCACCGGSIQVISRGSTRRGERVRLYRYGCGQHVNRGQAVCRNSRMARLELVDAAIREHLAREVLKPSVIEAAVRKAVALLRTPETNAPGRKAVSKRLREVEATLSNLTDAIAKGGAVPAVLDALNRADAERRSLVAQLKADSSEAPAAPDAQELQRTLRGYLADWHAMAAGNVSQARELLGVVVPERITFTPIVKQGRAMYELQIPIALDRLITSVVPCLDARVGLASPSGDEQLWSAEIHRVLRLAA